MLINPLSRTPAALNTLSFSNALVTPGSAADVYKQFLAFIGKSAPAKNRDAAPSAQVKVTLNSKTGDAVINFPAATGEQAYYYEASSGTFFTYTHVGPGGPLDNREGFKNFLSRNPSLLVFEQNKRLVDDISKVTPQEWENRYNAELRAASEPEDKPTRRPPATLQAYIDRETRQAKTVQQEVVALEGSIEIKGFKR